MSVSSLLEKNVIDGSQEPDTDVRGQQVVIKWFLVVLHLDGLELEA